MFYHYTSPTLFYQHLHNKITSGIIKTGKFLGFFCIQITLDGKRLEPGSRSLKIWSKFSILIQISYLIYFPYFFLGQNIIKYNSTKLNCLLRSFTDVVYILFLLVLYWIIAFRQNKVLEIFNSGAQLYQTLKFWNLNRHERLRKSLLYNITTKIVLDIIFVSLIFSVTMTKISENFNLFDLVWKILELLSYLAYTFVTTIYFIPFSFGLLLVQKLFHNLNHRNWKFVCLVYQDIFKFLKQTNSFMQILICLILFEDMMALVGEVRHN